MYNIYSIVILILFDIPRFSVYDLHQIQVAAPSPSSRKSNVNLAVLPVAVIVVLVCDQVHLSSTGHTHSRDDAPVSSSPALAARRSRRKIGR